MPNGNDFALRILGSLLTAGVIGVWGYAVTRASAEDLVEIEISVQEVAREGVEREFRIESQLGTIREQVHEIDVEQSAFRAQVREALRIPREN